MMKRMVFRGMTGFVAGIAAQYIAAIAVSLYLRLGYLLPYPASFAERFGGEMNAVLIVAAVCGVTGAAIGVITAVFVKH